MSVAKGFFGGHFRFPTAGGATPLLLSAQGGPVLAWSRSHDATKGRIL